MFVVKNIKNRRRKKLTDKEIQASDEEMEQFNVLQNEKCVSVKTEKLNDLKNRISFALKDATLQQGFEIICKRISELEKENADLKAEIGLNEATIQDQLEDRIKIIKENEDLKNQIKGFENDFDYQNKVIDKYKEDLKKLRVAYIQAQVANVISGTDFESILKSVLNGDLEKNGN